MLRCVKKLKIKYNMLYCFLAQIKNGFTTSVYLILVKRMTKLVQRFCSLIAIVFQIKLTRSIKGGTAVTIPEV
jgi:hypothetical protein